MAVLEGLKWKPMWVSQLGCIKGCLDYLGVDVPASWLFGLSGHAFVINIHEELCPSGPTAWRTERMVRLCEHVGCVIRRITGNRSEASFGQIQHVAWNDVRRAVDQYEPCYAWELDIPEYYVIHGYDDVGYLFNGPRCEDGAGPLPWRGLGGSGIGWLEVAIVNPVQPASDRYAVGQALEFALDHAANSEKWTFDKYKTGLAGFDLWIKALESNVASGPGAGYNAAVWGECRGHAARFLDLAKEKVEASLSPLFDEATAHYQLVCEQLARVCELFPFAGQSEEQMEANVRDEQRCGAAAEALRAARTAEERALTALREIVEGMRDTPA
jgi:hypothetical protein